MKLLYSRRRHGETILLHEVFFKEVEVPVYCLTPVLSTLFLR
jgi:hypothetical protein